MLHAAKLLFNNSFTTSRTPYALCPSHILRGPQQAHTYRYSQCMWHRLWQHTTARGRSTGLAGTDQPYSVWPCNLSMVMAKAGVRGKCLHLNLKGSAKLVLVKLMQGKVKHLAYALIHTLCFDDRPTNLAHHQPGTTGLSIDIMRVPEQDHRSSPSKSACVEA
ncbi:hypothetical protein ABBQ32_005131 [Trebouxia sp. C0010 RCD-2024]